MATEDLATRLTNLEKRVEVLEKAIAEPRSPVSRQGKKLSAKEFLMTKNVRSEVQRVLALAYFLEHQESLTSFNVPDLETTFRSAREKLPKNMNDAVNKNISRGFVMEAEEKKDSKKAWILTSTGERYVETEMNI